MMLILRALDGKIEIHHKKVKRSSRLITQHTTIILKGKTEKCFHDSLSPSILKVFKPDHDVGEHELNLYNQVTIQSLTAHHLAQCQLFLATQTVQTLNVQIDWNKTIICT